MSLFALNDLVGGERQGQLTGLPVPPVAKLRIACYEAVVAEFNPTGFHEALIAREIAHRAADMIRDGHRLDMAQERAEHALAQVLTPTIDSGGGGMSYPPIDGPARMEGVSRTRLQNSSAVFRMLEQLRELQHARDGGHPSLHARDSRFASEPQCIGYLARRFRLGYQVCRRCGGAGDGSWIAARKCWECAHCRTQTTIRFGTVMSRSALSLTIWFHAIRVLLFCPAVDTADLAGAIGVRRLPTVRSMAAKIRAALLADDATTKLASLDTIYLPAT